MCQDRDEGPDEVLWQEECHLPPESQVPKGAVYGFLGPNGAGKTTTIKMLTGALKPTYGEIRILGQERPRERVEIMRKVDYMPEASLAYDDMAIFEFLVYMGRLKGLSRGEAVKECGIR